MSHMIIVMLEVLFILAAFSLLWWGIGRMAVPEPIKTIVLVVFGLVALWFLWTLTIGAAGAPRL